ncbi:MAG: DUF5125 domain-containing protein [Bacteroides sp.]|uniref:DUF5016 domain-containing protein n=1 Tax=Bacteroides sp. TaxID=29523 RepID=UPI001B7BF79C|nr:DUF5125 domain-containing protein [Bacteroides sp.]MBP9585281.1 DUF5125 domain-containing protein [Bacteroides sp.]
MKTINYFLLALVGTTLMASCKDDEQLPGNPVMDAKTDFGTALFGDSLPFVIHATDVDVPLSTLKAQLFYGEEKVSETVIRTKTSGTDYSGKIYIPYLKDIPNGKATLKFILQNIHFTLVEKENELTLSRPDYPALSLVTKEGKEIVMPRVGLYQYAVNDLFEKEVPAFIKAPKMGANGNEITFGWENNKIVQGSTGEIPFLNAIKGVYPITFNSKSYAASPFFKFLFNGTPMEVMDSESYSISGTYAKGQVIPVSGIQLGEWKLGDVFTPKDNANVIFALPDGKYKIMANFGTKTFSALEVKDIDVDLTAGTFVSELVDEQVIRFSGIADLKDWWIDPDFFTATGDHFLFAAAPGKYKITANKALKYLVAEAMKGNEPATLQSDGTGAVWIIGDGIGKPSVELNQVSWNTDKALCMAPLGNGKYRITVVGDVSIKATAINFKFFHQKGWGGEFKKPGITSTHDVIVIPNDDGNLSLATGKVLKKDKTYVLTLDLSAGNDKAVLSVEEK